MKKSRQQKRSDTKKMMIISIILIIIIIPFMLLAANSFARKAELEKKIEKLEYEISQAELQKELYEEEISRIGTPEYYEYLARKLLGYIYEGETIMVITDNEGAN